MTARPPAAPESDVSALGVDERATLLRVLDWGVETRNMTYLVALKVLGIADRHAAALVDLSAARERVRVVERSSRNVAMDLIHEAEEATARAESAEAAHEALRERMEALADEWEQETRTCDGMTPSAFAPDLRALLAGGEER